MKSNWELCATRDTFNLIDKRTNRCVCWGTIDGCGTTRNIDMPDDIRRSNPSRLAVLRAIGDNSREGVLLRAMAYYRGEMQAAKEMGTVAFVEDMAIWAQAAIERRHFSVSLA